MAEIKPFWQNYIDGAWADGGAGRIDVLDPATGEVLAAHALADAGDVDRAVQAAKRVHLSGALRGMRPIERGRLVQAMGRYLLDHKDDIARVLTLEQGKPLWEAMVEVEGAALYFEYYGNQASTVEGRSIPLGAGYFDWTEHEPLGVSAQIPESDPVELRLDDIRATRGTREKNVMGQDRRDIAGNLEVDDFEAIRQCSRLLPLCLPPPIDFGVNPGHHGA